MTDIETHLVISPPGLRAPDEESICWSRCVCSFMAITTVRDIGAFIASPLIRFSFQRIRDGTCGFDEQGEINILSVLKKPGSELELHRRLEPIVAAMCRNRNVGETPGEEHHA
jgi:hypothetical protein